MEIGVLSGTGMVGAGTEDRDGAVVGLGQGVAVSAMGPSLLGCPTSSHAMSANGMSKHQNVRAMVVSRCRTENVATSWNSLDPTDATTIKRTQVLVAFSDLFPFSMRIPIWIGVACTIRLHPDKCDCSGASTSHRLVSGGSELFWRVRVLQCV